MNNKKCHYCGFINFVTAEQCRKCEAVLTAPSEPSSYDDAQTYRGVNAYAAPPPTRSGFPIVKGFVLVGFVLVVFATVSWWGMGFVRSGAKVKWIEYHPDGLPITVMMPDNPVRLEPVVTQMPNGSMSSYTYASTVPDQGVAVFGFVDFNGGTFRSTSDRARGLEAALQSYVQQTGSTLISKREIEYQGMPGLEFELKPPDTESVSARGYGKIFTSAARAYLVCLAAIEGSDLMAGKEKFLNPQITPTF